MEKDGQPGDNKDLVKAGPQNAAGLSGGDTSQGTPPSQAEGGESGVRKKKKAKLKDRCYTKYFSSSFAQEGGSRSTEALSPPGEGTFIICVVTKRESSAL